MAGIKICLIGHYPPPYGGESIEVQAIAKELRAKGVDCLVLNIGENRTQFLEGCTPVKNQPDYVKKTRRAGNEGYLIHMIINGHNLKSWLSALPGAWGGQRNRGRSILTLGSGDMPGYVQNVKGIARIAVKKVLNQYGLVIARNEQAVSALDTS